VYWYPPSSVSSTTVLFAALSQPDPGISICYWADDSFFDLRRLKAKTRVLEGFVCDFLFVYDCALAAHSEPTGTAQLSITVNLRKAEVLSQPALALYYSTSYHH